MHYLYTFIKNYPWTVLFLIIIWILCFTPYLPETPLDNVHLMDKWTHIAMYFALCCIIWYEKHKLLNKQKKRQNTKGILLWVGIAPLLMGGLIEILQENCTNGHRSGDWLDFIADAIGIIIALIFCIPLGLYHSKFGKDM